MTLNELDISGFTYPELTELKAKIETRMEEMRETGRAGAAGAVCGGGGGARRDAGGGRRFQQGEARPAAEAPQ